MSKATLFTFLILSSLSVISEVHAQATSIGQNGEVERLAGINNRATEFGSEAEEWKKKYPIEKIKRDPKGVASEDAITYCLGGSNSGMELAKRGEGVETEYGGYMVESAGNRSAGVVEAYSNQRINRLKFNNEIKKRNEAAGCNSGGR